MAYYMAMVLSEKGTSSVWLPTSPRPLADVSREPLGDERQGPKTLGRQGLSIYY
jgi:hypothetical protein